LFSLPWVFVDYKVTGSYFNAKPSNSKTYSKCYNLIERFSEDIDLVVLRHEGETDNKLKTKLKAISEVVENVLPEATIDGITHKVGTIRKTAHAYSKEFKGNYG
jgi:hypothetical protein